MRTLRGNLVILRGKLSWPTKACRRRSVHRSVKKRGRLSVRSWTWAAIAGNQIMILSSLERAGNCVNVVADMLYGWGLESDVALLCARIFVRQESKIGGRVLLYSSGTPSSAYL